MPRSFARPLAVISAFALVVIALTGCSQPPAASDSDCSGPLSKVLLTDDSGTTAKTFSVNDLPKAFTLPATPAPTCYYTSVITPAPSNGIAYTETHRTLLYIGLSDEQLQTVIAAVRKTVSVAPWSLRFDYGAPPAPATPPPTPVISASSSARWYYNFNGKPTDDKGEMGYYASTPVTKGLAIQAGLSKPVNVLRIETQLRQVKK